LKTFGIPDLDNDPVVRFQEKYYLPLVLVFCNIIPIMILKFLWPGMTTVQCFAANQRAYMVLYHFIGCVNSLAHMWGDKPYDGTMTAVQNPIVAVITRKFRV